MRAPVRKQFRSTVGMPRPSPGRLERPSRVALIAWNHPVRVCCVGAPEDFLDRQVEVTVEPRSAASDAFDASVL